MNSAPARWRTSDGLTIVGERWGDDGAPLVVFLHGIGQSRHAWRAAARAIVASGFSAITFDARGHGESDWASDHDYARPRMTLDLDAVLADVEGPVVLVGFSMGGDTCLLWSAADPAAVAGVALVDVAPHVEPAGVGPVQRFLEVSLPGFAEVEDAVRAIAELNDQDVPDDLQRAADAMRRHLRVGDGQRWFWRWDPAHFQADPPLDLREAELDSAARASGAVPLLLVRGALSSMLSDRSVDRLRAVRPDLRYVNVAEAGHGASGATNSRFADAVVDFAREAHGLAAAGSVP